MLIWECVELTMCIHIESSFWGEWGGSALLSLSFFEEQCCFFSQIRLCIALERVEVRWIYNVINYLSIYFIYPSVECIEKVISSHCSYFPGLFFLTLDLIEISVTEDWRERSAV